MLIGGVSVWALVSVFGSGSAQDKIRLEAIKLAGSIVVGTGGTAALVLAARRQRSTELGVLQKKQEQHLQEQAQRLQEQRDADARHDATERRVTELYTAAAEQLGSDKAPVRMAGLYALDRLGQKNSEHRQTILNLLCAYLRMPYSHPEATATTTPQETPPTDGKATAPQEFSVPQPLLLDLAPALTTAVGLPRDGTDYQQQELQVRLTAQRLLTKHVRPKRGEHGQATNPEFWDEMDLNLAGATLDHWDFSKCSVHHADFTGAHFHGPAGFREAQFHEFAGFRETQFHSTTWFDRAQFHSLAWFGETEFHGPARFDEAQFHEFAGFRETRFHGPARFDEAQFHEFAGFRETRFHGPALFRGARFHDTFELAEAWARLDAHLKSVWSPGWDTCERDPGDGREGRWGKLVRVEEEPTAGEERP